ncbi:MAG TPA: protein kinase [Candidatus Eisenbacteria bacterium]
MSLAAGTRLGPYEITSKLGEGGMGEVYLARDTRLERDVAIKVMPHHLKESAEARARFEREARAVSSLNHPNICTLHDVGRENGIDFLVMERVDGETLADRLARGPLPIPQLLRIGIEIADALDRAHRSGLVHRDLKPGNVMLARSGAKLMDFGLARARASLDSSPGMSAAATQSPTMAQPVTEKGMIVGTFQYMAPEQFEGKEADARSDLWALGCVLYEMATGQRAFTGQSRAGLISAIMAGEPAPMSRMAPLTPPAFDRLVRACLEKDRDERIQSAHDVKLQLRWIVEGEASGVSAVSAGVVSRRRGLNPLWAAGAALALVGLTIAGTLALHKPRVEREAVHFSVVRPPGLTAFGGPAVSHDGRQLAFVGWDSSDVQRLWLRRLDSIEAHQVSSAPAGAPIWSPDDASLAFVADDKLVRIGVGGGAVVPIADVHGRLPCSWSPAGTILLEPTGRDSLVAVSVADGTMTPASRLDRARGDLYHFSARFLPDGRHFLFVAARSKEGGTVTASIMLGRLGSLEAEELGPCDGYVAFDPPNHVIFLRGTTLVARTLDLGRKALTGEFMTLAEDVPPFTNGLIYSAGGGVVVLVNVTGLISELVWTDRTGRRLGKLGEPDRYRELDLSPDGKRLAVSIEDPASGNDDIWVRDIDRGISTRFTFSPAQETSPIWSADGTRIFYSTDRQGGNYLTYSFLVNSPGQEDTLRVGNYGHEGPLSVSPDGRWLAVLMSVGTTAMDDWNIVIRDVQGRETPRPFCVTPAIEASAAFSPDGRWLAYGSEETGRGELYVRSFPDGARKWRVSNAGGSTPHWARHGTELLYQNANSDIVSVPVTPGSEFQPGTPEVLFHADLNARGWVVNRWAVTSDGERFLLNQAIKNTNPGFTVMKNWDAGLR